MSEETTTYELKIEVADGVGEAEVLAKLNACCEGLGVKVLDTLSTTSFSEDPEERRGLMWASALLSANLLKQNLCVVAYRRPRVGDQYIAGISFAEDRKRISKEGVSFQDAAKDIATFKEGDEAVVGRRFIIMTTEAAGIRPEGIKPA